MRRWQRQLHHQHSALKAAGAEPLRLLQNILALAHDSALRAKRRLRKAHLTLPSRRQHVLLVTLSMPMQQRMQYVCNRPQHMLPVQASMQMHRQRLIKCTRLKHLTSACKRTLR